MESKVKECVEALLSVNKSLAEAMEQRRRWEVDLAAIKEQKEKTRSLVFLDLLTGLCNRALPDEGLFHALIRTPTR